MRSKIRDIILIFAVIPLLAGLWSSHANAVYSYPEMPSDWQNLKVTIGTVELPLSVYPDGSTYADTGYMTVSEQRQILGTALSSSDIYLRGWQCCGFARYVYTALFYRFPADAVIDLSLAMDYNASMSDNASSSSPYGYYNMIEVVLGKKYVSAGYDASTLKTLITSCKPGAVIRVGDDYNGHSMVLMGIFDDGIIVYDANFSGYDEVDVRRYTWAGFVDSFSHQRISAVQMPVYYPGYSYSSGGSDSNGGVTVDTSTAGTYTVVNATNLNVRSGPGTQYTLVGSVAKGTTVTAYGSYGDWFQIAYSGLRYWVYGYYLSASTDVSVTFDPAGGNVSTISGTYTSGASFGTLPTPTKTNRIFLGWYYNGNLYTSSSTVPTLSTFTLTARWSVSPYNDVIDTYWYASEVENAYTAGLISSDTAFRSEDIATRAEMITVLGREYERESSTTISSELESVFSDCTAGTWYNRYVTWAYYNGIVSGVGNGIFDPSGSVTREQIVTFLYRYGVKRGVVTETVADKSVYGGFVDSSQVDSWAASAITWAVREGILRGSDLNELNPRDGATRAEMVALIYRYLNSVGSQQAVILNAEKRTNSPGESSEAQPADDNSIEETEAAEVPEFSAASEEYPSEEETPDTELETATAPAGQEQFDNAA